MMFDLMMVLEISKNDGRMELTSLTTEGSIPRLCPPSRNERALYIFYVHLRMHASTVEMLVAGCCLCGPRFQAIDERQSV